MKLLAVMCVGALSATLFVPTGASADQPSIPVPSKDEAIKHAKDIATRTQGLIALAQLADELTKTKGDLTLKSAGRTPVAEKTFFGVEFLVPQVEFEDSVTNTVFGKEIPGRRVSVKIWLDCNVECRVDVANIKLARHEDYEDTMLLIVPKLELIGHVPEGREFRYEVEYGRLRAKWLDSDEARAVRREMITKASRKAAEEFAKSDVMVEFRKGFKRELRAFLKPTLPEGRRIQVQFGDE